MYFIMYYVLDRFKEVAGTLGLVTFTALVFLIFSEEDATLSIVYLFNKLNDAFY